MTEVNALKLKLGKEENINCYTNKVRCPSCLEEKGVKRISLNCKKLKVWLIEKKLYIAIHLHKDTCKQDIN
jgi:hypothetical protein